MATEVCKLSTRDSLDMSPQDETSILANDATIVEMKVLKTMHEVVVNDFYHEMKFQTTLNHSMIKRISSSELRVPFSRGSSICIHVTFACVCCNHFFQSYLLC